jgi:transcriptional regulator with XRE-family HTH domain
MNDDDQPSKDDPGMPPYPATDTDVDASGEDREAFANVSREVGRRLRALRKAKGMSLDDVERDSAGRWSASAIGAYERGFRTLSLPRLHELASFYDVPVSVLMGHKDQPDQQPRKLVLDLEALNAVPEASAVQRFARSIILERGDFNGRVLSIRRDDLRAISALLQLSATEAIEQLEAWGTLTDSPSSFEER